MSCVCGSSRRSTSTAGRRLSSGTSRVFSASTVPRASRACSSAWLPTPPGWRPTSPTSRPASKPAGRPRAPVVERCLSQTRRLLEAPAAQSPLLLAHPQLADDERALLLAAIDRHVRPAHATWLGLLERCADRVRGGDGICHLPDGDALYRHHILVWTTLAEDPRAIHAYGLERLAEIEAEARGIARELGHDDVAELRRLLDRSPDNHVEAPLRLVERAEELIARAEDVAPRWFGRLPAEGCQVRAVEPHMEQEAPPAFYVPPSEDGSRKGVYYINTFDPASRPLHRMPATTFHEAVPGHHFQIAIEQELTGLPTFRRFGSRLAGGAFVEGWALYAERLAAEMGLYTSPGSASGPSNRRRGGRSGSSSTRASTPSAGRVSSRSTCSASGPDSRRLEAETETDRYISWPGQALSYMIGQREILALRAELEGRDGRGFDARAFHDDAIGHGALPLSTLRARLPGWVAPGRD